jgi:flagellar motor switch protein FliM
MTKDNNQNDPIKTTTADQHGIKAMLDKALESYDKLPMLEIVFERFSRLLTTSLRNLTSETVEIKTNSFSSLRFSSYYDAIKPPISIVVFKVIEWENLGLLVIDSSLVFSLVDLLFGGKKNAMPVRIEERSHTYIEQGLIKQIAEVILSELSSSFDPMSPATCVFERLESNPNFAAISRPGDAVIVLKMHIDLDNRGGAVDLIIPYATLEPIKDLLQQVFLGEKFGNDAEWEDRLINKVYSVELPLEAVIINKPTTIEYVANLKLGSTIILDQKQTDDVIIRCTDIPLFKGQLGKMDDRVSVNITTTIVEQE